MADSYETRQRTLDPDRVVEQGHARQDAEDRLRSRGIWLHSGDDDEGPPIRGLEESVADYRLRVEAATDRLLHGRHR